MGKINYPPNRTSEYRDFPVQACVFCSVFFKKAADMCRHIRVHTWETRYFCDHCPFSASTNLAIQNHIVRNHENAIVANATECIFCERKFNGKCFLEIHLAFHTKETPYSCNKCGSSFTFKCLLKDHQKRHLNARLYDCKFCTKTFNTEGGVRDHTRLVHENRKRVNCTICSASLSCKTHLISHMRLHTGEKPHKCEKCQRAFRCVQSLFVHNKIHHQMKPEVHHCPVCLRQFKNVFILRGHMKTHKPKDPTKYKHPCGLCSRKFQSNNLLNLHTNTHLFRERKFKCKICGTCFTSSQGLWVHVRRHADENIVNCKICNKSLAKSSLRVHTLLHRTDARNFVCVFCGKGYLSYSSVRVHLYRHLNEKPRICDLCGAERRDRISLANHKKLKHE